MSGLLLFGILVYVIVYAFYGTVFIDYFVVGLVFIFYFFVYGVVGLGVALNY